MKKQLLICMSAVAISALASGCNKNTKQTLEVLNIGTTAKIEQAVRDEYNFDMLASGVSELPLVAKTGNGEFEPLLAKYESSDSKTWKYTVKDNLKWSDGQPVTAEDILYSLTYDEDASKPTFTKGEVKGTYASYEISEDKKSISLTLESANVKNLENMATFRVRPKHIYENKSAEQVTTEDKRVTCGPYKLDSFSLASNTISFVKNEYYPDSVNVNKINYKLFGSEEVMYNALLAGEIDIVWNYNIGVNKDFQTPLANSDKVTLVSQVASNCPAMLTFNNKKGLFSDKNLRFAVSFALKYAEFNKYFGSEYSVTPNRSFAPKSLVGYKETEQLKTDLAEADKYMKLAGYEKDGSVYKKNGVAAEFSLTINASKSAHVSYGEFVKTHLESFGILVNLDTVDATHYNEKTSHKFAKEGSHAYGEITMEAAIMGYTAFGMNSLGGMYINGNHAVQGGAEVYSDELTSIMNDMDSAETLEKYITAAGKLQDFYAKVTPAIALYWDNLILAHNSSLKNLTVDANFGLNNVHNWSVISK